MSYYNLIHTRGLESMTQGEIASNYRELIVSCFKELKIDDIEETLILAVIEQESRGYAAAMRDEIKTPYRSSPEKYVRSLNSLDTEINNQKTSWGVMQVMGFTARDLGFTGISLGELLNPRKSIYYGIKYLYDRKRRFPTFPDWVAAYNQGDNDKNPDGTYQRAHKYVTNVLSKQSAYKNLYT